MASEHHQSSPNPGSESTEIRADGKLSACFTATVDIATSVHGDVELDRLTLRVNLGLANEIRSPVGVGLFGSCVLA